MQHNNEEDFETFMANRRLMCLVADYQNTGLVADNVDVSEHAHNLNLSTFRSDTPVLEDQFQYACCQPNPVTDTGQGFPVQEQSETLLTQSDNVGQPYDLDTNDFKFENPKSGNFNSENFDLGNLNFDNLEPENLDIKDLDFEHPDVQNLNFVNSNPQCDEVQNLFEPDRSADTTLCQLQRSDTSPLFVQQCKSAVSAPSTDLTQIACQLFAIDCDFDFQQAGSAPAFGHDVSQSHNPAQIGNPILKPTMHDVFSQEDYVKKLKSNPYTTGIFSYKGLSKEEVQQKVKLSLKRKQKDARKTPVMSASDVSSVRHDEADTNTLSASSHDREALREDLSRKRRRLDTPGNVSAGEKVTGTLPSYTRMERPPQSLQVALLDAQKHEQQQQSTASMCTPEADAKAAELNSFLQDRIQAYEMALTRANFPLFQRSLVTQVQPEIENFVRMLDNKQNVDDVSGVKTALEAWESDFGRRVVAQKLIMYKSLMQFLFKRHTAGLQD